MHLSIILLIIIQIINADDDFDPTIANNEQLDVINSNGEQMDPFLLNLPSWNNGRNDGNTNRNGFGSSSSSTFSNIGNPMMPSSFNRGNGLMGHNNFASSSSFVGNSFRPPPFQHGQQFGLNPGFVGSNWFGANAGFPSGGSFPNTGLIGQQSRFEQPNMRSRQNRFEPSSSGFGNQPASFGINNGFGETNNNRRSGMNSGFGEINNNRGNGMNGGFSETNNNRGVLSGRLPNSGNSEIWPNGFSSQQSRSINGDNRNANHRRNHSTTTTTTIPTTTTDSLGLVSNAFGNTLVSTTTVPTTTTITTTIVNNSSSINQLILPGSGNNLTPLSTTTVVTTTTLANQSDTVTTESIFAQLAKMIKV